MTQLDDAMTDIPTYWHAYPTAIQQQLTQLRQLIHSLAYEQNIDSLSEACKWGQLSFVCDQGSTIRIDKLKHSDTRYAIYFHCQTTLVKTFKSLYGDQLNYEKSRAIIFDISDDLPIDIVKNCLLMAFEYHQRKHLPLLGINGNRSS